MLGILETASKQETQKAWKKLSLAIHPAKVDKDWKEQGTKVFRKVQEMAKARGFEKEHFAENAFSSEDSKEEDTTTGKEEDTTMGDAPPWEDMIPQPGGPQQAVYEKGTEFLKALWENPNDQGAIQELEWRNKSIISLNIFSGLSEDEGDRFIIEINWFRTQFSSMKLLQQEALPKTINIVIQLFDEENKQHGPVFGQSTPKGAEEWKEQGEQKKQKEQKEQVQQKEQKVQDQQKVHEGHDGPGFKPQYTAKEELIDGHQMVGFIGTVVDAYMSCAHTKQLHGGNVEVVYLKVLNVAQATSKPAAPRLPVTFAQVEWFDQEEPSWIIMDIEEAPDLPRYPQMSLKPPPQRTDECPAPLPSQNITPPALKSEELDFTAFFVAWQQLSQKKATPAEMLAHLAKNASEN
ncbi:hypothetical protein C7212DRAFT_348315 [Tuber magnatum]|uniref:J domain-containing protein n=1 Tax=Tuber magnatum TaxID=42249 RepID=A0A317SC96_9PEZI|nr:hypothetical protein C7212DRAFT_348315 [Tuber magnatum]